MNRLTAALTAFAAAPSRGGSSSPITGSDAAKAQAAALAMVPGTVELTCAVADSDQCRTASYVVEIRESDGTLVRVLEDVSFRVLQARTISAPQGTTRPANAAAR